ncbi:hypothetical protein [Streptomyces sp. H27-H5]|uniref:hypothetical protein n=1 Tax=Streptomyces sp. H27-H5 TaxID=2996460 RepID=UPI00226F6326|nr:hypothetical protein [Streptomyces sp. H27-H5]MCY0961340.1 hypothetical protein [Streptomyces sp. H27-H5]
MSDVQLPGPHDEVESGLTAGADAPQADADQEDLGLVIDAPEGFDKPAAAAGRSGLMDQGL